MAAADRGASARRGRPALAADRIASWVAASAVFAFLLLPSLIVVPMALTPKRSLEFPPSGLSLHTFSDFFSSPAWTSSAATSVVVALIVMAIALTVGTLAAVGLHEARFPGRGALIGLILMPLVVPVVVLALGDFAFLARWRLVGTPVGIALAHSVLATPYVYVVVSASLTGLDPRLVRSARSLGARGPQLFRHVDVPAIRPGLAAGALFAFAVSFDEAVIAYFLQGPAATTLPVKMFTDIQFDLQPTLAAVSTLLLAATGVLLVAQVVLMRRRSRVALLPGAGPPTSSRRGAE